MNIGAVGGNNVNYTYQNRVSNGNTEKSFGAAMENVQGASTHLVLHKSQEGDADKSVGSWANARTGESIAVYEPEDFDPSSPVYKMKIWDKEDNLIEERTIDLNSVDPRNADSYEMYALSVYGEKSGSFLDSVHRFILMQAERESQIEAQKGSVNLGMKENWMDILQDIIKQQYEVGNTQGYLKFKGYFDFLSEFK